MGSPFGAVVQHGMQFGPRIVGFGFFGILFSLFLIPAVLMWLWNITIPQLFNLKRLEYWEAFRLNIIAGILFGGAWAGIF